MKQTIVSILLIIQSIVCPLYVNSEENEPLHDHTESVQAIENQPSFLADEELNRQEALQESRFGQLFVKMLSLLLITVLLFIVASLFLKRFMASRGQKEGRSGKIQVLEKKMLSPKAVLYLVEVEGEKMVVAEFPNSGQLIKTHLFQERAVSFTKTKSE